MTRLYPGRPLLLRTNLVMSRCSLRFRIDFDQVVYGVFDAALVGAPLLRLLQDHGVVGRLTEGRLSTRVNNSMPLPKDRGGPPPVRAGTCEASSSSHPDRQRTRPPVEDRHIMERKGLPWSHTPPSLPTVQSAT